MATGGVISLVRADRQWDDCYLPHDATPVERYVINHVKYLYTQAVQHHTAVDLDDISRDIDIVLSLDRERMYRILIEVCRLLNQAPYIRSFGIIIAREYRPQNIIDKLLNTHNEDLICKLIDDKDVAYTPNMRTALKKYALLQASAVDQLGCLTQYIDIYDIARKSSDVTFRTRLLAKAISFGCMDMLQDVLLAGVTLTTEAIAVSILKYDQDPVIFHEIYERWQECSREVAERNSLRLRDVVEHIQNVDIPVTSGVVYRAFTDVGYTSDDLEYIVGRIANDNVSRQTMWDDHGTRRIVLRRSGDTDAARFAVPL